MLCSQPSLSFDGVVIIVLVLMVETEEKTKFLIFHFFPPVILQNIALG